MFTVLRGTTFICTCLFLRRFDSEADEAGELEARETGDEQKRDHGKEKEERRNACKNSCRVGFLAFSWHGTFPEFLSLSSGRF